MLMSFFRVPEKSKPTDESVMFSPNVQINRINPLVKELAVDITPNMRVSDLENIIKSMGLYVQISCRIINRKLPDFSVSNWLLRDVYGVDVPLISSSSDENRVLFSGRNSAIH